MSGAGSGSERWRAWLSALHHDVAAGRNGHDNPAWSAIADRVRSLASAVLSSEGAWSIDPGDVAQDVLLRLASPGTLRRVCESDAPEAYVLTIIRNRVRDEMRSDPPSRWSPWDDHGREGVTLETDTLSIDEQLALEHLLAELSEDEWELIRLRFWEDRTIRDVAEELGISYSAAGVRLFRLLHKLRTKLAD